MAPLAGGKAFRSEEGLAELSNAMRYAIRREENRDESPCFSFRRRSARRAACRLAADQPLGSTAVTPGSWAGWDASRSTW